MVGTVDDTASMTSPDPPANLRQAVVLFSDGKDIYCAEPPGSFQFCTRTSRRGRERWPGHARSISSRSGCSPTNVDSLAMAELALRNGGAYMFAERPSQLISIFGILDRLLADDMPTYEMEWTVNAAAGTLIPSVGP